MRPLFHIVEAGDWPGSGEYRPSSLDTQGFVHLSYAEQVEGSANRFYAESVALDVVEIEPTAVEKTLVVEDTYGAGVSFPHVYGPVPASAANSVHSLRRVAGRWSFPVVRVSAVVLRDDERRVLSVRKRGTTTFMLPGGKPEPGESARDAAVRELAEEVSLAVYLDQLVEIGTFAADAANEPGHIVEAAVFEAVGIDVGAVHVGAEIEELRWEPLGSGDYPPDRAPLSARVFDVLRSR